jgi:AraC-like DNA-binding protein
MTRASASKQALLYFQVLCGRFFFVQTFGRAFVAYTGMTPSEYMDLTKSK